jgi:signal transduction histidine kinase
MSAEIQRRVFEPFFTTKGDQGTGLGLAMVYACMKRHGGKVTLTTAPGQGTTFRLSFASSSGSEPPPA